MIIPLDRPLRIGASLPLQHLDYGEVRRIWLELEALDVDVIFANDHFVAVPAPGMTFEGLSMLSAMAEVTDRATIGSLVVCTAFRNPNVVADAARTIDHISGGRFILGLGVGSAEPDFVEYGYRYGSAAERARGLVDTLEVITDRLDRLDPPPIGPLPILVGGGGEKVLLRAAAQYSDIWHWSGDPEIMAQRSERLDRWCFELGRDPQEIERAVTVRRDADWDAYVAAGFTLVVFLMVTPDLGPVRELVAWRNQLSGGGSGKSL